MFKLSEMMRSFLIMRILSRYILNDKSDKIYIKNCSDVHTFIVALAYNFSLLP